MSYILSYYFYLLLPGLLISKLAAVKKLNILFIVSFSYVFMVLSLSATMAIGGNVHTYGWMLNSGIVALFLAALFTYRRRLAKEVFSISSADRFIKKHRKGVAGKSARTIITAVTFGIVIVYLLVAGPYIEIPSDAWWHIGRMQSKSTVIDAGQFPALRDIGSLFAKTNGYWYYIPAYFGYLSGMTIEKSLPQLALANTTMFLIGVYYFSLYIFAKSRGSVTKKYAIAAMTVLFFVAHFGVNVFSYVRYYVFAPTFLNYILYLTSVALLLEYVNGKENTIKWVIQLTLLLSVMAMVHKQEVLLAGTMGMTILFVSYVRNKSGWTSRARLGQVQMETISGVEKISIRRSKWLLGVAVIGYAVLHVSSYMTISRNNPLLHNQMIPVDTIVPFLKNLYILDPTNKFYKVLTVWGVFVYAMFVWKWAKFRKNTFVVAGMFLPLFTVFNPLFTDLFLRHSEAEVLWRMSYAIPLQFVGAYLFVDVLWNIKGTKSLKARIIAGAAIAAMIALLYPISARYFEAPYSKIYTLRAVASGNDSRVWKDLYEFLNSYKGRKIITDPVTGYTINALTKNRYPGHKFYGTGAFRVDRKQYSTEMFKDVDSWLIVINTRDGKESDTGAIGKHWPKHIMKVSKKYSSAFIQFIDSHPKLFRRRWGGDDISVFEVVYKIGLSKGPINGVDKFIGG